MLTANEIQQWEDVIKTADKAVERKHRGLPVDRWCTTNEMHALVDAYAVMADACVELMEQNERLIAEIHRIGYDAMSVGNDAETEDDLGFAPKGSEIH